MEEAETSLETYRVQLVQVRQALASDPGNDDLVQLEGDLQQLISLTEQSLLEEKKKQLLAMLPPDDSDDDDDEVVVGGGDEDEVEGLGSDLGQLVGMKCQAPHGTSSSCHNAIVFQTESGGLDGSLVPSFDDVLVRVVFSHPVSVDMVPCPFYLEGKCRFEDERCKYSHGEVVRLARLTAFKDPDFSALARGSAVLAKGEDDGLWRHATVEELDEKARKGFLRFSHDHRNLKEVGYEDLLPLLGDSNDDDESLQSSSSSSLLPTPDDDSVSFAPVDLLDRISGSAAALGQWEAHTTGVASRLMAKMGYVFGTGLGKNSEGRVEPVEARIYPSGKSLDWCMEMREKKADDGKVKLQQNRHVRKRETNVFDFINTKLGGKRGSLAKSVPKSAATAAGGSGPSSSVAKESLNVQTFKIGEDVRRLEKDLAKLNESYERLKERDPAMAAGVKAKISQKCEQLSGLRRKEQSLNKSRDQKDSNKKLAIF